MEMKEMTMSELHLALSESVAEMNTKLAPYHIMIQAKVIPTFEYERKGDYDLIASGIVSMLEGIAGATLANSARLDSYAHPQEEHVKDEHVKEEHIEDAQTENVEEYNGIREVPNASRAQAEEHDMHEEGHPMYPTTKRSPDYDAPTSV